MDEKNETGPAVEPKQEQECKQARPHDELICELLDSRRPKTEREHAAAREIERLRNERDQYRATSERVSVCRDHTGDILDGPCVICERDELRATLDDPGTTHSEGCWTWGPKHYGCAENRIKALEAEIAAMRAKWDAARVVEPWKYWDDRDLPQAFRGIHGRRVRLVVEGSE